MKFKVTTVSQIFNEYICDANNPEEAKEKIRNLLPINQRQDSDYKICLVEEYPTIPLI
jgi:hypothetical protein